MAETTKDEDQLVAEVAEMIADWYGRSATDEDRELAAEIIDKIESRS